MSDLVKDLFRERDDRRAADQQLRVDQDERATRLSAMLPGFWSTTKSAIISMVGEANKGLRTSHRITIEEMQGAELRLSHPEYSANDGFLQIFYNPGIPSIRANRNEFGIVLLDEGDHKPVLCLRRRNGERIALGDEANQILGDFLRAVIR